MNYSDFLTILMKLSAKVYPRSRSKDEAFQRLLQDNVLPLAARRCPDSVALLLENEDVAKLFDFYAPALEQIFSFYATNDKRAHHGAGASGGLGAGAGMGMSHAGRSPIRATRAINSMKEAMGYQGERGEGRRPAAAPRCCCHRAARALRAPLAATSRPHSLSLRVPQVRGGL